MIFSSNQYVIKQKGDLETITITKDALCEWAEYYDELVVNADGGMAMEMGEWILAVLKNACVSDAKVKVEIEFEEE